MRIFSLFTKIWNNNKFLHSYTRYINILANLSKFFRCIMNIYILINPNYNVHHVQKIIIRKHYLDKVVFDNKYLINLSVNYKYIFRSKCTYIYSFVLFNKN